MERDTNRRILSAEEAKMENENPDIGNEQNGRLFSEEQEIVAGKGMLHHGRPLSEMEITELRIHKANNEFLGIPDIPEAGTGSGGMGGVILDLSDMQDMADKLDDRHNPFGVSDEFSSGRDSNFGRNYQGGTQSQQHFIEENSHHEDKKEKDKK